MLWYFHGACNLFWIDYTRYDMLYSIYHGGCMTTIWVVHFSCAPFIYNSISSPFCVEDGILSRLSYVQTTLISFLAYWKHILTRRNACIILNKRRVIFIHGHSYSDVRTCFKDARPHIDSLTRSDSLWAGHKICAVKITIIIKFLLKLIHNQLQKLVSMLPVYWTCETRLLISNETRFCRVPCEINKRV